MRNRNYLKTNGVSISTINKSKVATNLSFTETKMIILFEDDRELSVPLEWFPRLRDATIYQFKKWRFIGKGEGVHCEGLDEDISIENLLD